MKTSEALARVIRRRFTEGQHVREGGPGSGPQPDGGAGRPSRAGALNPKDSAKHLPKDASSKHIKPAGSRPSRAGKLDPKYAQAMMKQHPERYSKP